MKQKTISYPDFWWIKAINRRKRAEISLRQLSRAVEQSASTILITNLEGTIEFANPAFERITGYTLKEVIGQNPRMLKSGVTPLEVYHDLWGAITKGGVWQGELLNRKKNGDLYWENAIISPVRDATGQITHYVAVKEDITARKKAEETLRIYTDQLECLQAQLREQAIRDSLTGAFNRRYLVETLQRELARSGRDGYAVSLLMIDIDHFKGINDTYGHMSGDQALQYLVNFLSERIRKSDVLCRYGGEEFVILLPTTTASDALHRAEIWRKELQSSPIEISGTAIPLTVSIGIAATDEPDISGDELLSRADRALYMAKQTGRNRTVLWMP